MSEKEEKKAKKRPLPHTRAIQRDRTKHVSGEPDATKIETLFAELTSSSVYTQKALYEQYGLRMRILVLPVMLSLVLSLIWKQIGSVREAVRILNREGLLWVDPVKVSERAVTKRLAEFPAAILATVLDEVLPLMYKRWQERRRPLPVALSWVQEHFNGVYAVDGSTLDTVIRRCGLLRQEEKGVLGGRMLALLDITNRLPKRIWFEEDSHAHDLRFWEELSGSLEKGMLLVFDLGFKDYEHFDELTAKGVNFVTRCALNTAYVKKELLRQTDDIKEYIVKIGSSEKSSCKNQMRLIEFRYGKNWYRYITNVVDVKLLPAEYAVAIYWQRWRIEDAFNIVKRLLGLAYFWVSSVNGIMLQVWATWLLYCVLIDLGDEVAETLNVPFNEVSLEMIYRGLYHYVKARDRGDQRNVVAYLTAPENKDLGILKAKRKNRSGTFQLLTLTIPLSP